MSNNNKRPLVSFIVVAYNQEKYIEEAIRGAFEQTYEPLEIILSDDNSPDKTFEIMQRLAEEYDGPHKVILNRNEPNLGIGGHINRVMDLSKGEFIVVNAGDDISLPERTTELVDVWLNSGKQAKSIFSDCYKMRIDGEIYGTLTFDSVNKIINPINMLEKNGFVFGATHGWDKEVFELFTPLNNKVVHEDRTLPFRSLLIGNIEYIKKPLIKYRDGGISSKYTKLSVDNILYGDMLSSYKRYLVDYNQKIFDIKFFQRLEPKKFDYNKLLKIAYKKLNFYEYICALAEGRSNKEILLLTAIKNNLSIRDSIILYSKYRFKHIFSLYLKFKLNRESSQ